mgnify:FL=1|tara:strand:+ start:337 stop:1206 length:870 start_codon:yes stop_codon:yes gene_type:complete
MSLLDEDTTNRLRQALAGEPPAPAAEAEVPVSEPEVQVSSEAAQDVNEGAKVEAPEATPQIDASAEIEVEVEEGHRVPYNRFKQVLDARNTSRDEVESLRQQLEKLKTQPQQAYQPPQQAQPQPQVQSQEDDWWSEYQGETGQAQDAPAAVDPQYAQLQQRVEAQEVAFQKMVLEREINQAQEKFPSIDRGQILKAVVQNPAMPVMQIAEQYSTWMAGIEEAAVDRYLKGNPSAQVEAQAAQAPPAAPRPSQSGSGDVAAFVGENKPQTVEEGSKMFKEFLKTHNPFAQ